MENVIINSTSELILRAKIICLHRLNKPILSDVKSFRPKEKTELVHLVKELLETYPESYIIKEFNEIADDKLFQSTDDYTLYPVIDKSFPSNPPIEEWKINPTHS